MVLITITFEGGQEVGQLNKVVANASLLTIGYPVFAASISSDIHTDVWSVEVVAEGVGFHDITFARGLPTSTGAVASLANVGIAALYPLSINPLPVWEKRSSGYFIYNPTSNDVTFDFNSSSRTLWVGGIATPTIPAGGSLGPFQPIPTLGAVSQNIEFQDGGIITLPLSAAYGESLLVHLPTNTPWPSKTGVTATMSVRYPAINSKSIISNPRPFEITANVVVSDQ